MQTSKLETNRNDTKQAKMKLYAALFSLFAPFVTSQCLIDHPDYANFEIDEQCTYEKVLSNIEKQKKILKDEVEGVTNCLDKVDELGSLLGLEDEADMKAKVETICNKALSNSKTNVDYVVNFEDIPLIKSDDSETISRFIKEFYDGGTHINEMVQQRSSGENYNLEKVTGSFSGFYNNYARKSIVKWPTTAVSNFQSCAINAAMCCWVQDRQAGDDNGNCEQPYPNGRIGSENLWSPDNCIDKDPADNTDICYVDMSRSPQSNHVVEGGVIYDDQNGDREGDAHCHGFAWADDSLSLSNRYRGNNLFFVSMYDHLKERGYVQEVPGAPMCGCIEQMPTVTRSDCTEMEITESFRFEYVKKSKTFHATITQADIAFNACQGLNDNNNDLQAHYEKLVSEGTIDPSRSAEMIEEFLVGEDNCAPAINSFIEQFNIKRA